MTARQQWVFRHRCGCPFGVLEGGRGTSETVEFYELPASEVNR